MKELKDQRNYYCDSITTLQNKLTSFRSHLDTMPGKRLNLPTGAIDNPGPGYKEKSPARR